MTVAERTVRATRPVGPYSTWFRRFEPITLLWFLTTLFVLCLILIPGFYLARAAFWPETGAGIYAFLNSLSAPATVRAAENTLIYVVGVTTLSTLIGVPLAFLVERTNISPLARDIIRFSVIFSVITPGFLTAMAYVNLLGPNNGALNLVFRSIFGLDITRGPINIYSLPGVIFLGTQHAVAYIFLITAASFSRMNPEFEEAAAIAGTPRWRIIATITLPLARNAILAGVLIAATGALADYGTPYMLGYTVLTIRIRQYMLEADFGGAASVSLLLVAVSVALFFVYRMAIGRGSYATVTGKSFRPGKFDVGRARMLLSLLAFAFALLAVVLPTLGLIGSSLLHRLGSGFQWDNLTLRHYEQVLFQSGLIRTAFFNSFVLGAAAAVLSAVLALVIGYITVRLRGRYALFIDYVAVIPLGFAGTALAVALIITVVNPPFAVLGLYGTLWILLAAYLIRNFPLAIRPVQTSMMQVSAELEEAARSLGGSWLHTMRTITFPLILSGVWAGMVLVFLGSFTELSASIILRHIGTDTVATAILDLWDGGGGYQRASAVAVCVFLGIGGFVIIAQKLTGRSLFREE